MKISWLRAVNDNVNFKLQKNLGFDVFEIDDLEETDNKIKELVNERYNTIIISNEIAGFSEDIIKKYAKDDNINIIIARNRKEY